MFLCSFLEVPKFFPFLVTVWRIICIESYSIPNHIDGKGHYRVSKWLELAKLVIFTPSGGRYKSKNKNLTIFIKSTFACLLGELGFFLSKDN